MSIINASSLLTPAYSGDCPLAKVHGALTLAAAQIGDKVRLNKVYAGTKVYKADMIFGALGTGSTVSLGFEYVDGQAGGGAAAFIAATDTHLAGTASAVLKPIVLQYDAYITATVAGAAASGALDSVITFEFQGK